MTSCWVPVCLISLCVVLLGRSFMTAKRTLLEWLLSYLVKRRLIHSFRSSATRPNNWYDGTISGRAAFILMLTDLIAVHIRLIWKEIGNGNAE